jgi:hypothetical protein
MAALGASGLSTVPRVNILDMLAVFVQTPFLSKAAWRLLRGASASLELIVRQMACVWFKPKQLTQWEHIALASHIPQHKWAIVLSTQPSPFATLSLLFRHANTLITVPTMCDNLTSVILSIHQRIPFWLRSLPALKVLEYSDCLVDFESLNYPSLQQLRLSYCVQYKKACGLRSFPSAAMLSGLG